MFESIKNALMAWNSNNSERAKLQHAYIVLAGALLLVACVIGLMNHELGQNILAVAIVCAAMFLANAVAWSLLQSAILFKLVAPKRSSSRKK